VAQPEPRRHASRRNGAHRAKDCYFNQIAMGKYINQNYITKLGLEHLKSFATRGSSSTPSESSSRGQAQEQPGVRKPWPGQRDVITAADIQAGLKMYNVTLREGDIVVIHTGWGDLFDQFPAQNATFNSGEPGIGKDAAKWLSSRRLSRSAPISGRWRSSLARIRRKPSSS